MYSYFLQRDHLRLLLPGILTIKRKPIEAKETIGKFIKFNKQILPFHLGFEIPLTVTVAVSFNGSLFLRSVWKCVCQVLHMHEKNLLETRRHCGAFPVYLFVLFPIKTYCAYHVHSPLAHSTFTQDHVTPKSAWLGGKWEDWLMVERIWGYCGKVC